ncbi:MAG TPA: hypothetical protein VIL38_04705, partial [Thermaerobacter sp.]
EMVMERLRHVDQVAYVRFASVYRQFKDIETFRRELDRLLAGDEPAPAPGGSAAAGGAAAADPAEGAAAAPAPDPGEEAVPRRSQGGQAPAEPPAPALDP